MLATAATAWAGWTALLAASEWHHRRAAGSIKHRILVGGMRGKSTLVRLLHTGLLAAQVRTLSRITGDELLLLLPNGQEERRRRWGPPNIREMRRTVREAARVRCDALCVENMAIDPTLVRLAATHIVLPTILVLGADAEDHTEHYSPNPEERARQIIGTWPAGCTMVVSGSKRNAAILNRAADEGREIVAAGLGDAPGLRPFMRELLGAALAVLRLCGAERGASAATQAATESQPLRVHRINDFPVIDMLSVNDPDSARELLSQLQAERRLDQKFQLVFLHRTDRPGRLLSFESLLREHRTVIAGDPVPLSFRRRLECAVVRDPIPVLHSAEATTVLVGNRHSSAEVGLQNILAGAAIEKW